MRILKSAKYAELKEGEPNGHDWEDANCQNPKTCRVCEVTEGETGDHKWTEATCTKNPVCEICEAVNKDVKPLGHTTNFGVCERCNANVGRDIVNDIIEKLSIGSSSIADAYDESVKANKGGRLAAQHAALAAEFYSLIRKCLSGAAAKCGDIKQLANVKAAILDALNTTPTSAYDSTYERSKSLIQKIRNISAMLQKL